MTDYSKSFRRIFTDEIFKKMIVNPNIWVVTSDLGYGFWDQTRASFPDRFLNVGAAEQSMVGIGVGLALEGKIPILYSITPFLLYRPFETIRNYVNREKINVKLIGSGRGHDYEVDGFSHWAEEDTEVMKIFKNIKACWPKKSDEVPDIVNSMIASKDPWYVNLRK